MKKILLFISLFISILIHSQVKFGQPSSETLYFLNHLVSGRADWEMEKKYYDGDLQEVIIYKSSQLYYDLKVKTDAVERYMMVNGVYSHRVTHFPSMNTQLIKQRLEDQYNKIDDFYFTTDYKYCNYVTLINGMASVIFKKYEPEFFSEKINSEVYKKRQEYANKEVDRELARNYRKSLLFDYFNLREYDSNFVKLIEPKLIDLIVQQAKIDLEASVKNKRKRSFKQLKTTYNTRFYAKSQSQLASCDITHLDSTISYRPSYIKELIFKLPIVKKEYDGRFYDLNREVIFQLDYVLERGSLDIKHRKNKPFEILSDTSLNSEIRNLITSELKKHKSGKYTINFQYGTINSKDASVILVQKLNK